jgi:extradiol dioxygenase family protein
MNTVKSIGHVAIPIWSVADTRHFYGEILGCPEGRLTDTMIDFNFFGQHLVCHLASDRIKAESKIDATHKERLSRHFGVIVDMAEWKRIAKRLEGKELNYVTGPVILNEGTDMEEGLIFMVDPAKNTVEFKGFDNPQKLSKILG